MRMGRMSSWWSEMGPLSNMTGIVLKTGNLDTDSHFESEDNVD